MSDTTKPVFYTRDNPEYKGSKIALWANTKPAEEGKKPAQFTGTIGKARVQLWEVNGSNGPFYNVKAADSQGNLVQLGTANAFVNTKKFNSLSISLRFDNEADANKTKEEFDIKEAVKAVEKAGQTTYFLNLYADVSRHAIEANKAEFERLKFNTEFDKK